MKKLCAILLLLAMLTAMTARKKEKDSSADSVTETVSYALSGTYKITQYTEGGQIYDIKSRGLTNVSIHFNPDGTGVINGKDGDAAFTYTENEITTTSDNSTMKLRQRDGKIFVIQNVNGVDHTMIFQ